MKKFKVTGKSGISEVIEASDYLDAAAQFIEHHNDLVAETIEVTESDGTNHAYITEEDTYGD